MSDDTQLDSTRPWRTARGATVVGSETERTERSEARASSRECPTVLDVARATLTAGTLVVLVMTSRSLYFSLSLGLTPCDLRRYQRIPMYPFVVVLGATAVEDRPDVWRTVFPLSLGGLALSAYHSYLQVTSGMTRIVGGPCTSIRYSMFGGLLTIPRLAFIGFVLVTVLAVVVACAGDETDDAWGI